LVTTVLKDQIKNMLHNIKIIAFLICTPLLLLTGCYKDKTVLFDTGEEITRPVTFSQDIVPLFSNNCSLSGCHISGGKPPDLSASNAFSSLTVGNYLNTTAPESSIIYQWMTGKKSTPMPTGGINKDYNALILAWIKQGAQNN
jgi:hypothetical protein